MKRVFSGVQPSGNLHVGNLFGAFRQWVRLQDSHECFFCVVDLHALTVPQDPEAVRRKTQEVAGLLMAVGLDPEKVTLFVQSHVPAHAELCWLLNAVARVGELSRMTQYKDKAKERASVTAGLLNYPVLMAADILLYQAHLIPVGDDQKQHLEFTRNVAERWNSLFGPTFVVPEPLIPEVGARIMAIDDPTAKMSKSGGPDNYLALLDPPDVIRGKIGRAVTDSGREIRYDPETKPGISNLLAIYALCRGVGVAEAAAGFDGVGYAVFKEAVAEAVVETLRPIQARYAEIISSGRLSAILETGRRRAAETAEANLRLARERIGLLPA